MVMRNEFLALLAALVAQHNGVSIQGYVWVLLIIWIAFKFLFTTVKVSIKKSKK